MTSLSIGLNLSKQGPRNPTKPSTTTNRKTVFGDQDSDSDGETQPLKASKATKSNSKPSISKEITSFDLSPSEPQPSPSSKPKKPTSLPPKTPTTSLSNTSASARAPHASLTSPNLSTQRTQQLISEQTAALDPSIYDYDAAYDALQLARDASKKKSQASSTNDDDGGGSGARYMTNLLAAAETRKRDYERAQDKLLQREREAEGDEFADKEKFVTGAYKVAQEERRQREAAEKLEEEEQKRRRKEKGMAAFYSGVMEDQEARHRAQMEAVEKVQRGEVVLEKNEEEKQQQTAEQLAAELNKTGAKIALDADGMVADKRQLLKGGLNITPAPKSKSQKDANATAGPKQAQTQEQRAGGWQAQLAREAQRQRQTRMIEHQLEQAQKRAAEQEVEDLEKKQREAKSRKTEGEISSAKERYLQRKREREEEAKREEENGKAG